MTIAQKRSMILRTMLDLFTPVCTYIQFRTKQLSKLNENNVEIFTNICNERFPEYPFERDKPFIGSIVSLVQTFINKVKLLLSHDTKINLLHNAFDVWHSNTSYFPIEDADLVDEACDAYHNLLSFTTTYFDLLRLPYNSMAYALITLIDDVINFIYDNYDNLTYNPSLKESETLCNERFVLDMNEINEVC